MHGQAWPSLAVKGPSQALRASTSGEKYGIISFPLAKLTNPGCHDLTFGFKNDAMRCNICIQMPCGRHSSLYIAIGPAPEMLCFLHSGAQGWHNAVHHSLTSSNLCDVCGQSLFIHSSGPSRYRFLLNFHKSSFFHRKTKHSHMTLSYLLPLGGLQIGFVRHPCRSPNASGQSHFGHIAVKCASINDGILSLRISRPILCTNHGIHCFPQED